MWKIKNSSTRTIVEKMSFHWTPETESHEKPPLVLLHGWGAGAGCFFKNIQEMANDRSILLIDLPGFGESERHEFSDEPEQEIETYQSDLISFEVS